MYNFINENKNNKCIDIRIKIKLNREPNFRIEALPKINSTATKYHILLRLKAKSLA